MHPSHAARSTVPATLVALAAIALAFAAPAHAGKTLTLDELKAYSAAVRDSAASAAMLPKMRAFLTDDPDSAYALFVKRAIAAATVTSHAPGKDIVQSIESIKDVDHIDPTNRLMMYLQASDELTQRKIEIPSAISFANRALANVPSDHPQAAIMRAASLACLGRAQLAAGRPDSAIAALKDAIPDHPDSQSVLVSLGQAYEKKKQPDLAINAYVRSLGCYEVGDSSGAAPLRALWKQKHGSLAGLDQAIAAAKREARTRVALEPHRDERPAPAWALKSLEGKPVALADFKGKVVVMDFFGSWCGPCRLEMPLVQKVYERYRNRGVVFLGMNWEQPGDPGERMAKVKAFITENQYSFPIVIDHDRVAGDSYQITGFPTLFVVDKKGQIRFRNVGADPGIERILADQIDSVME